MESFLVRKARRREWWKQKKIELRKKRDKTATGKSSRQSVGGKRKSTVDRNSKTIQVDLKRGFRSSADTIKIHQSSQMKRESLESEWPSSTHSSLSYSEREPGVEIEPVSDTNTELPTESVKTTTQNFTNKQKRNIKAKILSNVKQSPKDATSGTPFKKRYILFLGNLPHGASQDDVIGHFSKRGVPIKELRLLTDKESGKSKGCAFAEFSSNTAMQNALKFHRSKLQGRTINVEVTCGGGGKGDQRLKKIRERNRTLRRTTTVKSGKVIKSKRRT